MIFKRKVKYSNILAVRRIKRNLNAETLEKLGYIVLTIAVLFGFNASFSALI